MPAYSQKHMPKIAGRRSRFHCLRDDASDFLSDLDWMIIGKMGIAYCGPMPPGNSIAVASWRTNAIAHERVATFPTTEENP